MCHVHLRIYTSLEPTQSQVALGIGHASGEHSKVAGVKVPALQNSFATDGV